MTIFEAQERREHEMRAVGKYDKQTARVNKLKLDGSTNNVMLVYLGSLCACALQFLYECARRILAGFKLVYHGGLKHFPFLSHINHFSLSRFPKVGYIL